MDSLETSCRRAVEILREGSSQNSVDQAVNLITSETRHLQRVTSNFGKTPKVSGQTKLNFLRLGKTKKSKVSPKLKYKQLKIDDIFQKPKKLKRKLTISSDSETVSAVTSDGEAEELPAVVPALGSSNDESLNQKEDDTILAAGPSNLVSTVTGEVCNLNREINSLKIIV